MTTILQDTETEQKQKAENSESTKKRQQSSLKPAGKNGKDAADGAKDRDYIHVRARRGQATNSHSLAERVTFFCPRRSITSFVTVHNLL